VNFISGGAETIVILPSCFKSDRYGSSGYIPDAVSTIKIYAPCTFNIPTLPVSQFQKFTYNEN
jgi:hypothetical protein